MCVHMAHRRLRRLADCLLVHSELDGVHRTEPQRGTERHRERHREGEKTQSAQPTAATERHRERRRERRKERRNERAVARFGPEVVHARLEAFPPRVEMHGREFAEVWRLHEDVQ